MDCKPPRKIDLHIHSTASDGSLTPLEIMTQARRHRLAVIAITDHDTLEGAKEAFRTGIPSELELLPGVEISAAYPETFPFSGSCHILGYAVDLDDPGLNSTLLRLQQSRRNRNPRIIERLNQLGYNICLEEVEREVGPGQVARPHIAQLLVKKGVAATIDDAFERYLKPGQPAYVDKERIGCRHAIEMIRKAGGLAVLAHPALLQTTSNAQLEAFIGRLKEMGLKGIETLYPSHTPEQIAHYARLAQRFDLIMTGGTDFHGAINPDIQMGCGTGDLHVPYSLYTNLLAAL